MMEIQHLKEHDRESASFHCPPRYKRLFPAQGNKGIHFQDFVMQALGYDVDYLQAYNMLLREIDSVQNRNIIPRAPSVTIRMS